MIKGILNSLHSQKCLKLIRTRFPFVVATLSLMYFGFWWIYKLDVLPGLHGDEAWFALKGVEFSNSGIHELHGMTRYTGILQSLSISAFFKALQIGIWEVRISGVVFNLLALIILFFTFRSANKSTVLVLFVLILSQSALYLTSPRVAWEVNTFTFFFISLVMASTIRLLKNKDRPVPFLSSFIFLVVNFLGSYNHIIFSCLPLAALGAVILWNIHRRKLEHWPVGILSFTAVLNDSLLFLLMEGYLGSRLEKHPFLLLVAAFSVIALQIACAKLILSKRKPTKYTAEVTKGTNNIALHISRFVVYVFIVACISIFLFNHGIALIDVFSNYRILTHVYSYQPPLISTIIFTAGAVVLLGYAVFYLGMDLLGKNKSLFAFFIVSYMGLFSLYTIKTSFRYYLVIYIILALYVAWKINSDKKNATIFCASVLIIFITMNASLLSIFSPTYNIPKAIRFRIGNKQIETSAHFLPNKPLIDFLSTNEVGQIRYRSGRYFLEKPIEFYKVIKPWKEKAEKRVTLEYDYDGSGSYGYKIN